MVNAWLVNARRGLFATDPSAAPSAADGLVVGPLAAFACFGVWAELHYATRPSPWPPGAYLLVVAAAVPLLWRRRRPLLTAVLCLAAVTTYHLAGYPGLAPAVLAFLACAALGLHCERHGLLYGLLAMAVLWAVPALPPHSLPLYALDVSMPALSFGATAVLAHSARRRRLEHDARLREEAAASEERLGRRLAEERLRIARELHDVVAHTISVVAVQSNVALDALAAAPPDTDDAREAMLLVRGAARQALPELRAALDLLRGRAVEVADGRPQPGLGQLAELADQFRESGLDVELRLPEGAQALSPLVQLTVYRIVQEALTNTLRHARAGRAIVTLTRTREGEALVLRVADDGTGGAAPTGSGGPEHTGGFGLLGMRERAESLGGRVHAGPQPDGGWLVQAELPWESS
ncbi:sensor histidine kinase [Streptacidiphilus anmyonensis]|uniref:sensor histidine kinase n=1 Tax=Streptacidiphilus anmyonensis TaxID=405782 RepID=UPI0006933265|nr:sensor histidine kinase [Streptacidiphilus anmyonensis]